MIVKINAEVVLTYQDVCKALQQYVGFDDLIRGLECVSVHVDGEGAMLMYKTKKDDNKNEIRTTSKG